MLKKFISALLAVVIVTSTFTTMTVSATEENPASLANNDVSVQGENSFGDMLSGKIEDAMAQETTSADFALSGLKIEGQTATVEYTSAIDCTILVALYDEATNKMVASGKSVVSSEEDVATITIDAEEMPKYFVATAYMLDNNNAPLTDEFTTELYTEEIQMVKAMKATDFDEDRVLKLEETDETNFAVYSEDTKVLEYKENYNIPVTVDDENGIYVFSNANDDLKTLVKGDMLAYEYSADNIIILKVDTIKIDGDTVTITEGDAELEDVFDYVKIEATQDTSDCEFDMNGIDESVQLVDDASSVSSKNTSPVGAVEGDVTFTPEDLKVKLFGDATGKNIAVTGDIGFGAKATLEFYISFEKVHVDFDISYSLGCNITLTVKTKDTIRIPIVNISIMPVTGVVVSFTPTVVFEAQASITLSMGASGSFGFVSDENGVRTVCRSPETDTELKAKGEMFLGLQIKPQLSIVSKKIFAIGLPVTGGICVEAENRDAYKHKDEENGVKHLCHVCFEGNISAKISIDAEVELFGKKIGSVGASLKKPLFSFYYSVDFNDVGKGDCPHNGSEADLTEPTENTTPTASTSPTSPTGDTDETKPNIIQSGKCGDKVTWEIWDTGELVISGSGDMYNYSLYGISSTTPWYRFRNYISEIIIDNGITSIGNCGFSYMNIDEIVLPDTIETVGNNAFYLCEKLVKVTIPNGVVSIGEDAFVRCMSLTEVNIPNSVTYIADYMFANCSLLTEITIPDSVTHIGKGAFGGCESLKTITIPDSVTHIGKGAFGGCESLKTITIPDSVTHIGEHAFRDCTDLTEAIVPNSVKSIEQGAFFGCTNLIEINIPNSVTYIADYMFANCSLLTEITIPDSVTHIGGSAFYSCTSLTEINIPDGVTVINAGTFCLCTSLVKIDIPNSVTMIDWQAFLCTGLTEVTIPASVTSINDGAFDGCANLTDVYIYGNPEMGWYPFPETTTIHYMDSNSVSSSLATNNLIGNTSAIVAEFDNLIAGGDYIVVVVKSEGAEDLLSADNLLYIEQCTADESGSVSLECVPRESVENPVVLIFGAERMSISDVEVTALKDEGSQAVEYTVTLNGAVLTENTDYELVADGESVTITGINNYKDSITLTVVPMLIGDVNKDNVININDTTYIMKYLAELENLNDNQKLVADTNGDGAITITDATQIQKYLASLITSFN